MSEAMKRLQDLGQDFDAQDTIQSLTAKLERAKEGLRTAISLADAYTSGTGTIYEEGMASVRQTLKDIEND